PGVHAFLPRGSSDLGWTAPEPGDTGDPVGHGPAQPGFLTRGLEDPDGYYYRRLYTDAARAVDAARALPGADPEKVVVAGTSQGRSEEHTSELQSREK